MVIEPPDVVVAVTGPPLRLSVAMPVPAELAKVSDCPTSGVMLMAPPAVDIVADEPLGAVMVSGVPELAIATDEEAAVAVSVDPAPKFTEVAVT